MISENSQIFISILHHVERVLHFGITHGSFSHRAHLTKAHNTPYLPPTKRTSAHTFYAIHMDTAKLTRLRASNARYSSHSSTHFDPSSVNAQFAREYRCLTCGTSGNNFEQGPNEELGE